MLRSLKEMRGFHILAEDGKIGKVTDFYLDDMELTIRYAIVDTGNWLQDHRVLISTDSFIKPDYDEKLFPISLTKEEIENSPSIEEKEPVSRQMEKKLAEHYQWTPYWTAGAGVGPEPAVDPYIRTVTEMMEEQDEEVDEKQKTKVETHLRSDKEVERYSIAAKDGDIGHVEDFIVDDDTWLIRYLEIDTRNWLPGKKVLIAPEWIIGISWNQEHITVKLNKDKIKNAPEYKPDQPITREYEHLLYEHYGINKYWN